MASRSVGWTGISHRAPALVSSEKWRTGPARHEAGSPNVLGVALLARSLQALAGLDDAHWHEHEAELRALLVDEVYGDLHGVDDLFTETTPYAPSSPYSASKAASDHLVRAWNRTYGLPVLLTNCSNNYGPFHFPEKLIPLVILNALAGKPLPVYGNGLQVRDWLFARRRGVEFFAAQQAMKPANATRFPAAIPRRAATTAAWTHSVRRYPPAPATR